MAKERKKLKVLEMPTLPLRDVVVYPHTAIPLFVGRERSVKALDVAMASDKQVLLVTQKNAGDDLPSIDQVYRVGTVATILQLLKLPDGTIKVLVEGQQRARVVDFYENEDYLSAKVTLFPASEAPIDANQLDALARSVLSQFDQYIKMNKKVSPEVLSSLVSIVDDPVRFADAVAGHLALKIAKKQEILEIEDDQKRLEHLLGLMEGELEVLQMEQRLRGRVKKQMEKSQREYYLNEKMKAIQKELGGIEGAPNEHDEYAKKIQKSGMNKEVKQKAVAELNKLNLMPAMSAEATVVRNYLDWLVDVPWKKKAKLKSDLKEAAQVLEDDHYGLESVKERILEYLAVQQRVKKLKGPILCLVGPPGVGKTSVGRSIARATGRKFTRMALGGVRDEAEIRGHRRTYIGSMPGKFVQNLAKVKVRNPLFLLDEVDKMSMDFRGDPASALLEVLDPEQNSTFQDHYLEVDFDLSDVMFVCTANSMNIPPPLLDRMEVIRLPGYTEEEKKNIAKRYLIPRQIKDNGLDVDELKFSDAAVTDIIRYYTREAGVRGLEREISKVARKVVKSILFEASDSKSSGKSPAKPQAGTSLKTVTSKTLPKFLGVQKYRYGIADEEDRIGQVTGLAWTEVGGELLTVEAAIVPGKGKLAQTGKLGDVMQESVHAAMTVVRSRAEVLGIEASFHENKDVHIHVPEGATPKDGPSAGIAMCTALVSALTRIPARATVAMTGEITLRGEVLPIGGLKEKLLAALRGGIATVLIPEENTKDLKEIPQAILKKIEVKPVKWIDEVLDIALVEPPIPLSAEGKPRVSLPKGSRHKAPSKPRQAPRH